MIMKGWLLLGVGGKGCFLELKLSFIESNSTILEVALTQVIWLTEGRTNCTDPSHSLTSWKLLSLMLQKTFSGWPSPLLGEGGRRSFK